MGSVAVARDATQRRDDERRLQQRIRKLEEQQADAGTQTPE
ncbi:hypothetical protein U5817_12680 [Aromatoleum evansii]|uniref:PAC domain-containing protein n=1 Tax=Aromatoleum evansii TaxID=59406 RepID=A0ABZ1ASQ7_AROEV|nr:hypothetical protein U5817_12680 [Aromatoleum evansii]